MREGFLPEGREGGAAVPEPGAGGGGSSRGGGGRRRSGDYTEKYCNKTTFFT